VFWIATTLVQQKENIMLNPEYIKKLIPGIITRTALSYPFDYIESISFLTCNKIIASCFWRIPKDEKTVMHQLKIGNNNFPGCYIYNADASMESSNVEIVGRDTEGKNFIVSLPLTHFMELRHAS
jgi:hypothetical protein